MWYIGAFVTLIFAMITDQAGIQDAYLIAAGLFAIAGEIGVLSTRFKKFLDDGVRVESTNEEDGEKHDGEI